MGFVVFVASDAGEGLAFRLLVGLIILSPLGIVVNTCRKPVKQLFLTTSDGLVQALTDQETVYCEEISAALNQAIAKH